MIPVARKNFVVIPPAAKVNNATGAANVIDTYGFRYLEVIVVLGATDIAFTALKLQESDVKASGTALTGGTDVPGTVSGTDPAEGLSTANGATAAPLPQAADGGKVFKFEVDLRGRKRYLLLVPTVGNGSTGAFVTALAQLSRGEISPTTAAQKGAAQVMRSPVIP